MIESTHNFLSSDQRKNEPNQRANNNNSEKEKKTPLRNGDLISFRSRFIALLVVITFPLGIDAGGVCFSGRCCYMLWYV